MKLYDWMEAIKNQKLIFDDLTNFQCYMNNKTLMEMSFVWFAVWFMNANDVVQL